MPGQATPGPASSRHPGPSVLSRHSGCRALTLPGSLGQDTGDFCRAQGPQDGREGGPPSPRGSRDGHQGGTCVGTSVDAPTAHAAALPPPAQVGAGPCRRVCPGLLLSPTAPAPAGTRLRICRLGPASPHGLWLRPGGTAWSWAPGLRARQLLPLGLKHVWGRRQAQRNSRKSRAAARRHCTG